MVQIENYSTEQRYYIDMMQKDIDRARQLLLSYDHKGGYLRH